MEQHRAYGQQNQNNYHGHFYPSSPLSAVGMNAQSVEPAACFLWSSPIRGQKHAGIQSSTATFARLTGRAALYLQLLHER
jgi:hypothetical protein